MPQAVRAQSVNRFHADINNGLPTNHVYHLTVDSPGYLWVATDNGVLRYNGYEFRLYTTADGLPNNDVWNLTLDRRNRLWIHSIAHGTGYFRNNRYHKAVVKDSTMLYPRGVVNHEYGAVIQSDNGQGWGVLVEENDTIRLPKGRSVMIHSVIEDGSLLRLEPDSLYRYRYRDRKLVLEEQLSHPWGDLATAYPMKDNAAIGVVHSDSVTLYSFRGRGQKSLHFTDEAGMPDQLSIFLFVESDKKLSVAIGRQTVYLFDTSLHIKRRITASSLTGSSDPANDNSMLELMADRFWGECVSTTNRGFFVNYTLAPSLEPAPRLDLSASICIGNIDSISCWWSLRNRTLTTVDSKGNIRSSRHKEMFDVVRILPYDKDRWIVFDKGILYFFYPGSRMLKRIPAVWDDHWTRNNKADNTYHPYVRDILLQGQHIYLSGHYLFDCRIVNDTLYGKEIGRSFFNITSDPVRKLLWFNHVDRVSFRSGDGKYVVITDSVLRYLGITTIEKLLVDQQYGNLLLKDNNNLYCFDFRNGRINMLFRQYNLKGARVFVHSGMVILAGKFGVLFSRILGPAHFSTPLVHSNIKNSLYNMALDAGFAGNRMYLKTDRGTYLLSLPEPADFAKAGANIPPYNIVFEYRDTLYDMRRLKTLPIVQDENRVGVDVINPRGNGKLFCYSRIEEIDRGWQLLNGNEIHLPALTAGKTYTLSLMASDDVWRSDPVRISLYIVPEWWQQPRARLFLWSYSGLIILLLLLEIILLTRYFVVRSARKKQFLVSLSLRAVYAQINPHFIFNTLNTALYFIRKKQLDEAAVHVTRFSHLLRAYLHSSRNRYISVADEITNLNNYIQLQQTRFENTFTYEIRTDDTLPRHTLSIPSLLLQPLVENAINHGLVPKGEGGQLSIIFHWDEKEHILTCIIDDNGVGRRHAKKMKTHEVLKKESYGSDLIRELIATFNQYEKLGIQIEYLDKQLPLTGTQVTIRIKNPHYEQ